MKTIDPFLASSRDILRRCAADMRTPIEGLPPSALDWRPGGEDTNSISALAFHALHSTRQWLSVAVAAPLPERDREAEFGASFPDAASLLRFTDDAFSQCLELLKGNRDIDWAKTRRHWEATRDTEFPAAWALLHALEHLREHIGHIGLTRQIWDSRAANLRPPTSDPRR